MSLEQRLTSNRPTGAFVISLLAGLLMLASGGMTGWGNYQMGGHMMGGNGFMGGPSVWFWHHEMMYTYGGGPLWSWVGIAAGVLVLVGALCLYLMPSMKKGWGLVILIASAVAMLAGTGGLLAGGLGLVGGGLAMGWRT